MPLNIGVIAMQGAFREHCRMVVRCGAQAQAVRRAPAPDDAPLQGLDRFDGLIIPGGESTVIGKMLAESGLLSAVAACGRQGMPIYGSCAGMILLCDEIEGPGGDLLDQPRLGLLRARVRRNAFGRQKESFVSHIPVTGVAEDMEAVFIRAPAITAVGKEVEVLAETRVCGVTLPSAIRQGRLLATSFHPELTEDTRFHAFFLSLCQDYARQKAAA